MSIELRVYSWNSYDASEISVLGLVVTELRSESIVCQFESGH